jgi:hypothetical protein
MSKTQRRGIEKELDDLVRATKVKSDKTLSGYEITLDPEYVYDLIESAKREGARQELEYMMTGKKTVTQYADSSFDDLVTYVFAASEIQDRLAQLKLSEESE